MWTKIRRIDALKLIARVGRGWIRARSLARQSSLYGPFLYARLTLRRRALFFMTADAMNSPVIG
jgi:hypothetical protein